MNLSKHISELLKYHECVIIPEFGAFISNYQSAKFDAVRNTFLPPSKEVIFNSKIRKNDGLLINHLVEAEQIGYHQAEVNVLNFTDSLFTQLNNGEKADLEYLGSMAYDRAGSIIFEPYGSFELIQAYGLKEFQFPTLNESHTIGTFKPRPAVRAINNHRDVLKIAASIALVLTLSLFPVKTEMVTLHTSALNPIEMLINETAVPVAKVISKEATQTIAKIEPEKTAAKPYILIGGCFQFESNAQQFQNELQLAGFHPEIIPLENGFFRVIVDSYTNKENALDAMTAYRSNHTGSGVWVSTR